MSSVKKRNQKKPHSSGKLSTSIIRPSCKSEKAFALQSASSLTSNLFFCLSVLCFAVVLNVFGLSIFFNNWCLDDVLKWMNVKKPGEETYVRMTAAYLDVPLREPFHLDFEAALKVRENNMRLYNYSYNRSGVDRRKNLSLEEYRDVYDGKWPVIIQDIVPFWRASSWSRELFCEIYGQERVVMKGVHDGLDKASTLALPLELFCLHSNESRQNSWTYIEDELFIPMRPWLRKDIGSMVSGDEDFFQLFPKEVRPWDSMLLWGTRFSRSSLHIDPYNWTGTNAVISGLKHWKLFPPGQDHFLNVWSNRKSEFPLNCYKYNSPVDAYEVDDQKFPDFQKARYFEIDQYPGELLLLPSGWFHQAYNMEETMAISSQFMNINNYRIILEEIIKIGNIQRGDIAPEVSKLAPEEQVKAVMSMLPKHIIERGQKITKDILEQVLNTDG